MVRVRSFSRLREKDTQTWARAKRSWSELDDGLLGSRCKTFPAPSTNHPKGSDEA